MKIVKDDFDKKKLELNEYFDFLLKLDKDTPTLKYSEVGVTHEDLLTSELRKILIANGFILIYNLVESFCRNFIIAILTEIQSHKLPLIKLSEKTQQVWIAQEVKNYKDHKVSNEKLEKCFYDMVTIILKNSAIDFGELIRKIESEDKFDAFGLSGSINVNKIRSLAHMYGFKHLTSPVQEKAGEDLEHVKDLRNKLAHGRMTFADCGKDKTASDVIKYKDNTINYLEGVLLNIEDYLSSKSFKT